MMIQLKIKALKSVLDANQQVDEEITKSNKKTKRLKKRSKLVNIISSESDNESKKVTSLKNRFKQKINKKSKSLNEILLSKMKD